MPCNIGYKSYAKIRIPEPQPQTFKAKIDAPKIDAELMARLGSEEPEFLEWINELDTKPLLEEALKRALVNISAKEVDFFVNDKGALEAQGRYLNEKEKRILTEAAAKVSERWQFEILGIVTQLLGYNATISQKENELVLEAEEEGKTHPCDYIKVSKKGEDAALVFEHFKSRKALELETAKFVTLAHKLGVKIILTSSDISEGDPFPGEERHSHHHGHRHGHNHHDHPHDRNHTD